MKFLKYLGLLVLLVIVLYLVACFFGPQNFNLTASKKIDAPPAVVFNLVNDIKKWEEWNVWNLQDTGMVVSYSDQTYGVGAKSTWTESENGNGTQEIIESVANEKIRTQLNFEGWDANNFANLTFTPNGQSTDVSWDFEGTDLPFLMRGMMLRAKSGMRKSYKKGLNNIAQIAEERVNNLYNNYTINRISAPERNFVMSRQEVKVTSIQQFYATNLGALFGKVQEAGANMNGMPCGLFFRMDERSGNIDMAAAIPTKEAVSIADAQSYHLEPKKALQIDYYGDYSEIASAHNAVEEFLRDRGYFQDVPIIEEYVTDPGTEKDPSKWLTKITYYYTE